jgi:Carboxypeptidase regulatory-like domain
MCAQRQGERFRRALLARVVLLLWIVSVVALSSAQHAIFVSGRILDPQGNALPNTAVSLVQQDHALSQTKSGPDGRFVLNSGSTGQFTIKVDAPGFRSVTRPITIRPSGNAEVTISVTQIESQTESITVTADATEADVLSPDPAEKVFVRQDLLDANPGRPGTPVSIPGYPIETASSGIKAPQYFAPGVAGDHGEPIAQYIGVGSYLVPNNLSANAHGNGYADPNIFIPEVLESVQVDGGAFNVREGNHSVNLAAIYGLRSRLDPFVALTGDYRDIDLVGGFSPSPNSWIALSGSFGNGFLDRLEHRQQYKVNGERLFNVGEHRITLFGTGYYGVSKIPGLVPIFPTNADDANFPNLGDTIDPRQKDQTHTALVAVNDVWQISSSQQLQVSGFFRTYNLALYSDFGQGLIRQSEFRTVTGTSVACVKKASEYLSLLGGFDYEREAPRRDDLDHYGFVDSGNSNYYGPFTPVAANNLTISPFTPYVAAEGSLGSHFRYYLGWRRDEINFNNQDLLHSENSFQNWVGVNSPKATFSFLPGDSQFLPLISVSFGQAFFTNDPRIGSGTTSPTPVNTAHSYQIVASKTFEKTDIRLTLGHVTTSQTLGQLDADTGLQEDQGPGRLRFMTIAVQHNFSKGSLLATFSKADARDLNSGLPTPEAPRSILDVLGTVQQLPFHLQAKGEFEYIPAKPLGTGCLPDPNAECYGVPVKEFRAAVVRPFMNGRLTVGVNMLIASGHTGQTLESFAPSDISEVAGVRIPSYASATLSYRFGGRGGSGQ